MNSISIIAGQTIVLILLFVLWILNRVEKIRLTKSLILHVLSSEQWKYGNEVRTAPYYNIPINLLYSVLYELEKNGLIEGRTDPLPDRFTKMRKRMYRRKPTTPPFVALDNPTGTRC